MRRSPRPRRAGRRPGSGALLREPQHRGAAVADALARALPGADDDRGLAFQSHCFLRFLLLSPWKTGRRNHLSRFTISASTTDALAVRVRQHGVEVDLGDCLGVVGRERPEPMER